MQRAPIVLFSWGVSRKDQTTVCGQGQGESVGQLHLHVAYGLPVVPGGCHVPAGLAGWRSIPPLHADPLLMILVICEGQGDVGVGE